MRIVTLITLGVVAAALTAGTADAAATASGFFKTQNGRIYCAWAYGNGPAGLVCGVKNAKLHPAPKNNCKKFGADYVGNRIGMASKGTAHVQACAGDAGPFANGNATKVAQAGKDVARRRDVVQRHQVDGHLQEQVEARLHLEFARRFQRSNLQALLIVAATR